MNIELPFFCSLTLTFFQYKYSLTKLVDKYSILFNFLEEVFDNWYSYFLNCLGEFTINVSLPKVLFVERVIQ